MSVCTELTVLIAFPHEMCEKLALADDHDSHGHNAKAISSAAADTAVIELNVQQCDGDESLTMQ